MEKLTEKKFKELKERFSSQKKKNKGRYNISGKKGGGKDPFVVHGELEYDVKPNKNLTITPTASQTKTRGKTAQKKRGLGVRYKDYNLKADLTKIPYSPNKKEIKLDIDNLFGGAKLKGSASKQGKNKQYRMDIKMPIDKVPILAPLFGYKKGGQIKRPKGVKIAQRGFGRAMKNGK